ncbi:Flp family type IVb pilin [Ralstonia soli]|uniref:Flp family type IVb pilin n=1 Tax=Ralstonia soli TaxID=2953896 RepID=A0ABT1AJP1_9RALS|nr:Flp family type IVb pilin [Ralstonia soli]MCO5398531.1 Flp family type IVb pilin [Ralstonia soli]
MDQLITTIKHFAQDEDGVTAIEYGLLAALIALAIIAAATAVGTHLSATFSYIASLLP